MHYLRLTTCSLLFGLIGVASAQDTTPPNPAPDNKLTLWYDAPAKIWTEALPVGNAHLGAMVFGGVSQERLQLNEDTLWEGFPHDPNNPAALPALPEIRKLLFEGKSAEATKLIAANMMGIPPRIKSYQPLGDLLIDTPGAKKPTNYRRSLDLSTGIATTTYTLGDTTFTREVFASHPNDVIVIRLTADHPHKINVDLSMNREKDAQVAVKANTIKITGQIQSQYIDAAKKPVGPIKPGMCFEGELVALPVDGTVHSSNDKLTIRNADSLILLVAAHTNYQKDGTLAADMDLAQQCDDTLGKADHLKDEEELRANHLADFQPFMARVDLDLGPTASDIKMLPTDQRLKRLSTENSGGTASDPELVAMYFQYGRYLLLSSSRPGSMPANLQGLWSEKMDAPWNSDYHTNINIQMNYWPAEVTNLSECTTPLFDFMDALSIPGTKTAQSEYGAGGGGWVVHHLTDPFLTTTPCDGPPGVWPMGAAWLCQHLWQHYEFTQDKPFLEKRAYPLMKGAAQFIINYLIPAPEGTPFAGKLVTNPSYSPENKFITADGQVAMFSYASTMDLEIIHDLLTHVIAAAKILGTDDAFRTTCEQTLAKLPPLQIAKDGRLQEWIEDYKEQDIHHRHTSHLFAVYPGDQITQAATPDLAAAAQKSLDVRGDKGATEWSLAWRTALWARFHDGDHAVHMLDQLIADNLFANLFNRYSGQIFQIDGNLGATAALAEMLLQSQNNEIQFLPALPKAWPTGHVTGLRARGNFTTDITWKDGKITTATLHSLAGLPTRIRTPIPLTVTQNGKSIAVTQDDPTLIEFPTTAGDTYQITP